MVKIKRDARQYPIRREREKPEYPGQKSQYKPGFGPQGNSKSKPVSKWVVILAIILIIIFTIIVIGFFMSSSSVPEDAEDAWDTGDLGDTAAGDECECYCNDNGMPCTSNSQCPESPPGVPGYCGCPAGC